MEKKLNITQLILKHKTTDMMSLKNRIVPHSVSYDTVERLNKNAEIILYVSTVLSLTISTLDYLELFRPLRNTLIVINSLLIALYCFLDNRANFIFTRAEMARRLDYIDNSFGTNFSGKKSENYFTNENLSPGLYKLCVNCFESSVQTSFTIKKMFSKIMLQTIVICLLFIVSAYVGNREVVRMFFELTLPLLLIQKLIKAIFFVSRIDSVVTNFKSLFNSLMTEKIDNKTPEVLRDVLNYETTLSWASLPLESKLFFTYQDQLAQEWGDLKIAYKIK